MFLIVGNTGDLMNFYSNHVKLFGYPGGVSVDHLPDKQFVADGDNFCKHFFSLKSFFFLFEGFEGFERFERFQVSSFGSEEFEEFGDLLFVTWSLELGIWVF